MGKIKLLVGLKIPDTTAITAFNTLKKMGFELEKLEREEYYEFFWLKDEDKFMKDIVEVDILVNANKNTSKVFKADAEEKDEDCVNVVVTDKGDNAKAILDTLRERLGFHDISEMKKGTLWKMYGVSKEKAEKMAQALLYNEHYQEFRIL